MIIENLKIENIRCIKKIELQNPNSINYILGDNAQGKSSILEAIYILCTSKSHRTFKDKEFINIDQDIATIETDVKREKRNNININLIISKTNKKTYIIDDIKKQKIADSIGEFNSVIFSSSDIEMIKGEPGIRRNFLNLEISQIYPLYANELAAYKKTLLQRNNILKDIKNEIRDSYDILDILDLQLSIWGAKLIKRRESYINKISLYSKDMYNQITNEKNNYSLKYLSNIKDDKLSAEDTQNALLEQIKAKKDTDIKYGTTTIGPHRDDMEILVNNLPVKFFGSSGEQRSSAFAIKLAEINIIREITGEYPIVLLDDIMSELDYLRRKQAIDIASKNSQTFITTTHLDNDDYLNGDIRIYNVKNGEIT